MVEISTSRKVAATWLVLQVKDCNCWAVHVPNTALCNCHAVQLQSHTVDNTLYFHYAKGTFVTSHAQMLSQNATQV